jgi:ADP-ribose pyrophosphatase
MNLKDLNFLRIKTEAHPSTQITLEYLEHHRAVCSLLLNFKETKALLVHQYRPGKQGEMYEIPAGLIDAGENEDTAILRELREETGFQSSDIEVLYKSPKPFLISPGYTTERLHFYICKLKSIDAKMQEQELDEGEDIICEWFDLDEVENISDDMKTILAINLYKQKIR